MGYNFFNLQGFIQIIQYLIVPITVVYMIFAFVVTRQVKLLNKSFSSPISKTLEATAFAQFIASLIIGVLVLISL